MTCKDCDGLGVCAFCDAGLVDDELCARCDGTEICARCDGEGEEPHE